MIFEVPDDLSEKQIDKYIAEKIEEIENTKDTE